MRSLVNPFEIGGKWYKANLHTHTTISDGLLSPRRRVAQYRRAGYNVLALTDHGRGSDVRGLSDGRMLVVGGIELHPTRPRPCHLVGLNVPRDFVCRDGDDANRCIADIRQAGGAAVLAHPYWCGQAYCDFHMLRGLAAVEVYNTTCDRCGRPCSENEWAYALSHGMFLPAVGVDDTHGGIGAVDEFGSWTWLKMPSATAANVVRAVAAGAGYASCGPKVHQFRCRDGKIRLRCSPAAKIQFVSEPSLGATRRADAGKAIVSFTVDLPDWPFVRAVVTDAAGRKAWTNPIVL